MKIDVFDSMPDGANESISFSVEDKLKILKRLDIFEFLYRGGKPGFEPEGLGVFRTGKGTGTETAKLVAFAYLKKGITPDKDENVTALLSGYRLCLHVEIGFHMWMILNTTLEENLNMIRDTIRLQR